jgi:transcription antitermination protein NusB
MTRRSRAREVALQLLFQRDHNPGVDRPALERFAHDRLRNDVLQAFCLALYDGVLAHLDDIDKRLTASADNWRLVRMATVDRNVLRLGAFELLFGQETPPGVAFDEAIELARRFGSAESAAFVNGVLDRLRREANPPQTSQAESAEQPVEAEPPSGIDAANLPETPAL